MVVNKVFQILFVTTASESPLQTEKYLFKILNS